jgi:hypothetical protein
MTQFTNPSNQPAPTTETPEFELEFQTSDGKTYRARIWDKQIALWFITALLMGWLGYLGLSPQASGQPALNGTEETHRR